MLNINTLIFDLDGTLVDSRQDIVNAVNFALKILGIRKRPFNKVISYIGFGVKYLMEKSLGSENKGMLKQSVGIFEDYYRGHCADKTKVYPHVESILRYFSDKNMFVATNRTKEMAQATLAILGIDKFFKDIAGGNDEACLKPSACPLNKFFNRYKLSREKSMIIGDMDIDVLSGKRASIHTCAVTYGIGQKEDILKAGPEYVIDDIVELKQIIC